MKKVVFIILGLIIILSVLLYLSMEENQKKCETCSEDYLSENHPFGFAGPSAPDNFDKIKALKVKYARESISWKMLEPSENQYKFDTLNTSGRLSQYGLEIIIRLKLGQIWATKCDKSIACSADESFGCPSKSADCPPKDLGNWSDKGYSPLLYDFVYKSLENAKNNGQNFAYLVIGNEVNTPVFWHGTADDYLKTRTTVYKATKDINSKLGTNYKVVDNGIASTIWGGALLRENYCTNDPNKRTFAMDFAQRYFRRIYDGPYTEEALAKRINCDNPSRDYLILKEVFKKDPNLNEPTFDLMSYHFYEPWDTQEEVINWIKVEMKKNGYDKPIMNTEGGYRDTLHLYSDMPSLASDIANEIPKLHIVAFANGVKTWLWLPFTERDDSYQHYGLEWKGLVSTDQKELPAYTSYKVMVEKLDGFESVEKMKDFATEYVYKFNFKKKKPIYILWSNVLTTIDFSSEIPGNVKVTRIDGSAETKQSAALEVTESPIYIEAL